MEGQMCWDRHMEKLGGTVGSVVRSSHSAPASSRCLEDWDKDDVMMEIVDALNQTLDNGVGICFFSGPSFARWLQAPFLITRPGDCHTLHDPIQDSSPSQGHVPHPPQEHTWPRDQIQVALGAWLVVRVLPAEDIGTGCYSNRAASPVTYSHWRHMHCRIQPGLSRWLSCHPSVQAKIER